MEEQKRLEEEEKLRQERLKQQEETKKQQEELEKLQKEREDKEAELARIQKESDKLEEERKKNEAEVKRIQEEEQKNKEEQENAEKEEEDESIDEVDSSTADEEDSPEEKPAPPSDGNEKVKKPTKIIYKNPDGTTQIIEDAQVDENGQITIIVENKQPEKQPPVVVGQDQSEDFTYPLIIGMLASALVTIIIMLVGKKYLFKPPDEPVE